MKLRNAMILVLPLALICAALVFADFEKTNRPIEPQSNVSVSVSPDVIIDDSNGEEEQNQVESALPRAEVPPTVADESTNLEFEAALKALEHPFQVGEDGYFKMHANQDGSSDQGMSGARTVYFSEGFDGTWPPANWAEVNNNQNYVNWQQFTGWSHTGAASAKCPGDAGTQDEWLYTASGIDLTAATDVVLEFYFAGNFGDAITSDREDYEVQVTADFGTFYTVWSDDTDASTVADDWADWQLATVDLSGYAGSHIYLVFRYTSEGESGLTPNGWFLDDVEIADSQDNSTGDFLYESFIASSMPEGWTTIDSNINGVHWYVDTWSDYDAVGFAARVSGDYDNEQQDEWLISPAMDLTDADPEHLRMHWAWVGNSQTAVYPYDNYDMEVWVSTDGGANFTTLLWDEETNGPETFDYWETAMMSLAQFAGEPNVSIAFRHHGLGGSWFLVDAIRVTDDPPPIGRCSFDDASCDDLTQADCEGSGGVWDWALNCTDNPVQPGDNCLNPIDLTFPADMPFVDANQTTCDRGNNYMELDLCYEYGYGRDQDMVYRFEVTQDTSIIVNLDPKGLAKTYFEIRTNCPPTGGDCIGYYRQQQGGGAYSSGIVPVSAGTYYLIVDSWIGGIGDSLVCIEDFDISIDGIPDMGPGNNCDDPIMVDLDAALAGDGYADTNTTCLRGNHYDVTCLGYNDGGEDIIYELTVTTAVDIDVIIDAMGTNYVGAIIAAGCPTETNCIAGNTLGNNTAGVPLVLRAVHLEPGTYYLMLDTSPNPGCIMEFALDIQIAAPTDPGDFCGNPIIINTSTDLPYTATETTCGRENFYKETCLYGNDEGQDVVYEVTLAEAMQFMISVDPMGTANVGVVLASSCPPNMDNCITKKVQYSTDPFAFKTPLDAGTYYVMVDRSVHWQSPEDDCIPEFEISFTEYECPELPNDNCDDVTPMVIEWYTTSTVTGTNECATNQCTVLDDQGHAWEAFTIDSLANVTIDLCGTTPAFQAAYTMLFSGCPCEGAEQFEAGTVDWYACDGNVTMSFEMLPAGTYYLPIMSLSDGWNPQYYYYEGPYTVNVYAEPTDLDYCSASTNYCDLYIDHVTFANLDHTSECENYADFTDVIAFVQPGGTYELNYWIANTYDYEVAKCFIDWNGDMDFNDDGEDVPLDRWLYSSPFGGPITIPMDAVEGLTRMRLRFDYAYERGPCGVTDYGEVEDYTISIGGDAPTLTIDVEAIDLGDVALGSSASGGLNLSVEGGWPVDYSVDFSFYENSRMTGREALGSLSSTLPEKAAYNGPPAPPANENMLRQGGDMIQDAVAITATPYTATGTTAGYNNNYDEVCPYDGSVAPDVVYSYVATEDQQIDVDMYGSSYDTKIYIYEDALGNLIACNDDFYSDYTSAVFDVNIQSGHTYYIVVDGYGEDAGDYNIFVEVHEAANPLECPPGAIAEIEQCGEFTNDGCNMAVAALEDIACGDTVCGNVMADDNLRDTDWFRFTLERTGMVTFTGTAEFPFAIGFVEFEYPGAADCDYAVSISPYAYGAPNDTVSVTMELPAGEHWLFVSASVFDGYPCGSQNGYWCTIDCDQPVPWLTADPASGSVNPGESQPVTVTANVNALSLGEHTAQMILTHNAEKTTVVIPVSVNVIIPEDNPALILDPDPINVMMVNAIDGVAGHIYLTDDFDPEHGVADVDASSLVINALITPLATEITTLEGITGDVLKISIPLGDFAEYYVDGLMWDCSYRTYTVTGDYTAGGTFGVADAFEFCGHTSGDLNLDGSVDISDLVFMVEYMFAGGAAPELIEMADVDGSGAVDIADLVYFVDFMFAGGPAPVSP